MLYVENNHDYTHATAMGTAGLCYFVNTVNLLTNVNVVIKNTFIT